MTPEVLLRELSQIQIGDTLLETTAGQNLVLRRFARQSYSPDKEFYKLSLTQWNLATGKKKSAWQITDMQSFLPNFDGMTLTGRTKSDEFATWDFATGKEVLPRIKTGGMLLPDSKHRLAFGARQGWTKVNAEALALARRRRRWL